MLFELDNNPANFEDYIYKILGKILNVFIII